LEPDPAASPESRPKSPRTIREASVKLLRAGLLKDNTDRLLQETVVLVADTLNADCCEILRILPGGAGTRLMARLDRARGTEVDVQETDAKQGATFWTANVETSGLETQLDPNSDPSTHSGDGEHPAEALAVIQQLGGPYGFLRVECSTRREFSRADSDFLWVAASILSMAIERQRSLAAVRESDERFLRAFMSSPDVLLISRESDGTILEVNERCSTLFGYSRDEIVGKTSPPFNLFADPKVYTGALEMLTRGEVLRDLEVSIRSGSGAMNQVLMSIDRLRLDGEPCILTVIRDVTDERRVAKALRKSEERLQLALTTTGLGVWEWNIQSGEVYWSPECYKILDVDSFDGTANAFTQFFHPKDLPRLQHAINCLVAGTSAFAAEFRVLRSPSDTRHISSRAQGIFDENGTLQRVVGTMLDVTERRLAEETLIASRAQLLDLSARIDSIVEERKTMVATEVHDQLGGNLVGIKRGLESLRRMLKQELPEGSLAESFTKIDAMIDLTAATIDTAKKISADLRPPELDLLGLVPAIRAEAHRFHLRTGIRCEVHASSDDLEIGQEPSTAIFRIFQEALRNIELHAGASLVNLNLLETERSFILEVQDDGRGISASEKTAMTSLGLLGMRERARRVGAQVVIEGAPGGGTLVTLTLPLPQRPSEQADSGAEPSFEPPSKQERGIS
jgi:two-component system sensor histidine kinase UhpB